MTAGSMRQYCVSTRVAVLTVICSWCEATHLRQRILYNYYSKNNNNRTHLSFRKGPLLGAGVEMLHMKLVNQCALAGHTECTAWVTCVCQLVTARQAFAGRVHVKNCLLHRCHLHVHMCRCQLNLSLGLKMLTIGWQRLISKSEVCYVRSQANCQIIIL